MMKVSFINYRYDPDTKIDEYLLKYPAMNGWNKALLELGVQVNVFNRFSESKIFQSEGVNFHLIKDDLNPNLKWYQNTKLFHEKILIQDQEIIHVNSFRYAYQASLLKKIKPSLKYVIQHHAEKPGHWIKRFLLKRFTSKLDGFVFSGVGIYNEWLKARAILPNKKFAEIMEGSSDFIFENRSEARQKTGLKGNPVLLWIGRLNENKDPLTVISGFEKLLNEFPQARLYMIYSDKDLKTKIDSIILQSPLLRDKVILLGFINYSEIKSYYNSSDYFVLGSHYEGSGFSLVEAMSCGVIPIVTDIPSFRMMTNDGKIGTLWKSGDSNSFYDRARHLLKYSIMDESEKTIAFFKTNLSYPAIAEKAKEFYKHLSDH